MESEQPTPAEYELLEQLWNHGPATVREIHERHCETRSTSYTTVLKTLQIMTKKGWVTRDENQRSHIYHPAVSRGSVQKKAIRGLLGRVFRGSAQDLVAGLLSAKATPPEELAAIRDHIDALLQEQKNQNGKGE